jgi:hypothetical protein
LFSTVYKFNFDEYKEFKINFIIDTNKLEYLK